MRMFIADTLLSREWQKTPFLVVFSTFLKNGWLGIAENRVTYRFLRSRSPRALGIDASFR